MTRPSRSGVARPRKTADTRRCLLVAAILLAAPPGSASAEGEEADERSRRSAGQLAELSLEELMNVTLNAMGITGIHHTHEAGELMVGVSSMFMGMDGNRSGTSHRSKSQVLADYMVSPTDMDMQMTMLHLMYAPSDRVTLMAMLPYTHKSMHHVTAMAQKFRTRSEGLGDFEVTTLLSAWRNEGQRLIFTSGVSFPTGSIKEKDGTPMGKVRLPYPMQLGSGTFDLRPGMTYLGHTLDWAWGARSAGTIRLGKNDNHYRLGNEAEVTVWGTRRVTSWLSASLRLDWSWWGNIDGADPQLNPALVPTADPNRRGGHRLDFLPGVNIFQLEGPLAGNRFTIEGGVPLYQWLYGPQLETDWMLSAAWDWTF